MSQLKCSDRNADAPDLIELSTLVDLVTFTTEQVEAKLAVAVAVLLPFCTVFRRSSTANLT